jgi:hypothetical protein
MRGYARTDDLVFTSGGQIRRGWDATMQRYRTRYGGDKAGMCQLAFELHQVQPLGADGAVVLRRWRIVHDLSSRD